MPKFLSNITLFHMHVLVFICQSVDNHTILMPSVSCYRWWLRWMVNHNIAGFVEEKYIFFKISSSACCLHFVVAINRPGFTIFSSVG